MKRILTSTFLAIFIVLTSCTSPQTPPTVVTVPTDIPQPDMPNPASAYCEQQGYRLEIRTAADGGQAGYCIFPDGSECDEWAYFRRECGPPLKTKGHPLPPGSRLPCQLTPMITKVGGPTLTQNMAFRSCFLKTGR